MASTPIHITPLNPVSYVATKMGGVTPVGLPSQFALAQYINARDTVIVRSTGHAIVPPNLGSNILIQRKIF